MTGDWHLANETMSVPKMHLTCLNGNEYSSDNNDISPTISILRYLQGDYIIKPQFLVIHPSPERILVSPAWVRLAL